MDFLAVLEGCPPGTGVDVPERDYPSLTTVERCVAYLSDRLEERQRA